MQNKILICSRVIPELYGNSTETALFKICKSFNKKKIIVHLILFLDKHANKNKKFLIKKLKLQNIHLEDIFFINANKNIIFKIYDKLKFFISVYHLSELFKKKIQNIVDTNNINFILDFYDCHEFLYKINNVKKILYSAHPDFAPLIISLNFYDLFFSSNKDTIFKKFFLFLHKFYVNKLIRRLEYKYRFSIKNFDRILTINYQTYLDLEKNGFKASYVPFFGPELKNKLFNSQYKKNKILNIVSSVGDKKATNTILNNFYVFKYLVPQIKVKLLDKFRINMYGAGDNNTNIRDLIFKEKSIIDNGFVKNFIKEFKNNDIMLLCQNSLSVDNVATFGEYKWNLHSVHGRILQAWSLNICIVAHSNNLKCMPELINGYNCLAGKNPSEITEHIMSISRNKKLRNKLILNGHHTLRNKFSSKFNINMLINNIIN